MKDYTGIENLELGRTGAEFYNRKYMDAEKLLRFSQKSRPFRCKATF